MTETARKIATHAGTAAWTLVFSGAAFFLLESRNHVTREEFNRHLAETAPMIRQMDESRGRVEERLGAIDRRITELVRLTELLRDEHAARGRYPLEPR